MIYPFNSDVRVNKLME